MARMPRLAVAGLPHLVVQRSTSRRAALADGADRDAYLAALERAVRDTGVAIHAFALVADTVLLLATPRAAVDLGGLMLRVNRRFVPAFHRRHGSSGALWAGRFETAAIEPEQYLLPAMWMVEQAPVRAGLVAAAGAWPWSSARHHLGREASPLVTDHGAYWQLGNTPFEREARHERELATPLGAHDEEQLLAAARGGWALGSVGFLVRLAESAPRALRPAPRGRPRQASAADKR